MSLNQVTLIGHLGADPEVRSTKSGAAVCNLRMATNERYKDRDGNWQDKTEWHRIVVFGAQAENCGKHLSKGRQVAVAGSLQTTEWEKDGERRFTTEVKAFRVVFLGGGGSGGGNRGGSPPADRYGDASVPGGGDSQREGGSGKRDDFDDDVPFRTRTYIPAEYRGGRQGRR